MRHLIIILTLLFSSEISKGQVGPKDVLVIIGVGQSNMGTNPSNGPIHIDSMPVHLKGKFPKILIDTVISSALYLTPLITNGTGAGYIYQVLWRESQIYKQVIYIHRSSGGTKIEPTATYPIADLKNYISTFKPRIHDIADTNKCDVMILYDQGETDGATLSAAVNFKTNWINFIPLDIWPNYWNAVVFAKRVSNMQTDFAYRSNLVAGMDSLKLIYGGKYYLINTDSLPMKGENSRTSTTYNGDYSHHREESAIKTANMFSDSIEYHFGKVKPDVIKPLLVSATINAAGTSLTLKFTETLNDRMRPHPSNFSCSNRSFIGITISGDSIVLTPASLFYSGTSYTISITKDGYFKINLQDLFGNELSTVTNFPIINNCTVSSPTFTTIYTSDFTTLGSNPSNLPNWWTVTAGGTTASANQTSPSGVTSCMTLDGLSGSLNRLRKWTTTGMNTSGKIYIVDFDIEIPRTMSQTGAPNSWYCLVDNEDHSGLFDFTKLTRRDQMTHIQYQWTQGTPVNDDIYLEFGSNSNFRACVKNFTIKSN